ncbi:low temperature requirement a protein [Stemphylium lycopersici]|nr:low temperature requirement a protein [Stemphylium lycopersici]
MGAHSRISSPSPEAKSGHEHSHHHEKIQEDAVPWFPSPMKGWDDNMKCFSPRHEASTIELFFDLWFVANLALFTQYHAITNRYSFWSYIAFFIVLWSSWFHIVCFDARFTSDSVWERACKVIQFCSFAAFALAGYKFMPLAPDADTATPHWIYRVLCFALILSRACLTLQYLMTTLMCASHKHRGVRLTTPLALNTALFLLVTGILGGLFAAFSDVRKNMTGVLIGLYVAIVVEWMGTLAISVIWRQLSFKATHIGERLGLLGLIIIGEGVIGTTKTIVRTMGKNGPTLVPSAQVFCIVLILVFMWILYFDKVPKYRFGHVKQQFWMALHLPFHLAILGVVEGVQHLAQSCYLFYSTGQLVYKTAIICVVNHLDGQVLASELKKTVDYFRIFESPRGTLALDLVWDTIEVLGNDHGVCSPANTTDLNNSFLGVPNTQNFRDFFIRTSGAMYQSFEIDIPNEGETRGLNVAVRSLAIVYTYFWSAIILLLTCYTITSLLAESENGRWRSRRYLSVAILSRGFMIAIAAVLLALGRTRYLFLETYVASAWLLPTVVLQLWVVCITDRGSRVWRNRKGGGQGYEGIAEQGHESGVQHSQERGTNAYGYPSHDWRLPSW